MEIEASVIPAFSAPRLWFSYPTYDTIAEDGINIFILCCDSTARTFLLHRATSHVATVLTTDLEQGVGDLTEARDFDGLHQFLKHVPAGARHALRRVSASLVASKSRF